MHNFIKKFGIISVLFIILVFVLLFSVTQGAANIPIEKVIDIIIFGNGTAAEKFIIFEIRVPRAITGIFVGASLALAGVLLQALFRNPMADPYVLGISAGAGTGAAIAILFGISIIISGVSVSIMLFAFIGAIIEIFIVYEIAKTKEYISTTRLLLSGIAVGMFFGGILMIILIFSHEQVHSILAWLFGSLASSKWTNVSIVIIPFFVFLIIAFFLSRDLNALLLGEETAQHLGIDIENLKKIILISTSMITACAVSVSGLIGFVGLVVPHVARILFGANHKILIPVSVLLGAIALLSTDILARMLIPPVELPVGVITAFFGIPLFLYLLRKAKYEF